MLEIVVLAILIVAVVGGTVLGAREREAGSWTWPVMPTKLSGSDPADEGASVPDGALHVTDEEMRKAA
jgi:hypothetical protein